MRNRTSAKSHILPPLKVSHKAFGESMKFLNHLPDAVFQTDLNLNITGWNYAASQLHGIPGAMGKNLFNLIKIDFTHSTFDSVSKDLMQKGSWEDEVIFHRHDGEKFFSAPQQIFFSTGWVKKPE